MRRFLFFTLVFILCSNIFPLDNEWVAVNFPEPSQELIDYVKQHDYEIIMLKETEFLHVIVTTEQIPGFSRRGWKPEILFTESELRENTRLRTRQLPGYRSYNAVLGELIDIAVHHPHIAALYNIGNSQGKEYFLAGNDNYSNFVHDIWAIKITSDPDVENDKPAVYYNGAQHAREPISVEVTMHILWHLVDNYGSDPEITFLVDNTEIWFIPVMNPDGHKLVIDQTNTMWRKNIRDNYNSGILNFTTDGVDLNRNYIYEWQLGTNLAAATYSGPYPSSEPETTALRNLWQERHFVAGISYHSYGQYVLYPPGYTWNLVAPDVLAQSALASEMAQTIPRIDGPGHYTAQHSWELYPATGTCEDDSYCNHGIFAYTFELASMFIPPPDEVDQICEDNLEAALILLRRVYHSTLTGIISDSSSGEPVIAEIFVTGIDDTGVHRAPYRSSEEYGRYYRMLLPGDYNVQFSAPGYYTSPPVTFSINDSTQTVLDYEMSALSVPEIASIFGTSEFIGLTWDHPSLISYPEGYRIYRDEILLNPDDLVSVKAFGDLSVESGHTYSYRVSAVYPEGESELSPAMTFTAGEGSLVLVENVSIDLADNTVTLQWIAIEDVFGYLIYSAAHPYADEWTIYDFTTEIEWSGTASAPARFFLINAVE